MARSAQHSPAHTQRPPSATGALRRLNARRRPALRLSDAVEPRRLSHSELYGDLLHRSGVEYGIAIGVRTGRGESVVARLGRTERVEALIGMQGAFVELAAPPSIRPNVDPVEQFTFPSNLRKP